MDPAHAGPADGGLGAAAAAPGRRPRLYLPGNECLARAGDVAAARSPDRAARRGDAAGRTGRLRQPGPGAAGPTQPPVQPRRRPRRAATGAPSRHRARRHHARACTRLRADRERHDRARRTCSTRARPLPSTPLSSLITRVLTRQRAVGAAATSAVGGVLTDDLLELQRLDTPPTSSPTAAATCPSAPPPTAAAGRRSPTPTAAGPRSTSRDRASWRRRRRASSATAPSCSSTSVAAGGPAEDRDRTARGRGADARAGHARRRAVTRSTTRSWKRSRSSRRWPTRSRALDAAAPGAGGGGRRRGGGAGRPSRPTIDAELAGDRAPSAPTLVAAHRRRACSTATTGCGPGSAGSPSPSSRARRCGGCHLDLSAGEFETRCGPRRPGSSPTARSAAACWCPDADAHVPLVRRHGDRHRVVRVPRPALRLPPADRRLGAAARRRAVTGGAGVLHTLVFSLVLLLRRDGRRRAGRRPVRKLLLGLPIGTLLHLVFDGAWTNTDLFWWPFGGWSFDDDRAAGGGARLVGPGAGARRARHPGVGLAPLAAVEDPAAPPPLPARRPPVRRSARGSLWNTHGRADPRPPRPHGAQRGRAAAGTHRRAARRGRAPAGQGGRRARSARSTS